MEVEAEMRALIAEHPHEVVAGDGLKVVPRVADGRPEEDAVGLQQVHRVHDSGIVPLAPPGIVGGRRALDGEHEGDVAQLYHPLTERLVDEGGVGVDGELHIVVLLRQTKDVRLPHQRLAAGEHIEVDAQRLAFGDDLVHILKAEVVLVAVLARPAAHTVHIAGRSGVEEDEPRDVAAVLDPVLPDGLGAPEECLIAEVEGRGAGHIGVCLAEHTVDELRPLAVRVSQHGAGVFVGLLAEGIAVKLLCHVHHLGDRLLTVLVDMGQCDIHHRPDSSTLHLVAQRIQCGTHNVSLLSRFFAGFL